MNLMDDGELDLIFFRSKISYDNNDISTNFLPANLKVGTGFDFILDDYNKVAVNLEFNKLLVPTPQNPDLDGNGTPEERRQNLDNYRSIGWVSGVFKSFEMRQAVLESKEVTYVGAEYSYQDSMQWRFS
jgi:hypothetical protein